MADSEKSATDEVRACEEKRDETKGALEENEVEVKALQSERSECSKERVAVTKKITAEETTVEQLRGKLHTVLQKAKVEEVDLPMVGGTSSIADGTSSESGSQAGSQSSETTASTHFSQKDNQQVRRDQTDAERVDFSELENHRDVEPSKLPKIKNDYESKLTELQGEIQQMQPNMKVGSTVCNR